MAMKRPSSAGAADAKRKRTIAKEISTVVGAIVGVDSVASDVRAILKTSLPIVLAVNKVDRGAFDAEVVGQAEQALAAAQSSLEESYKTATAARDAVTAKEELEKRKASKKTAEDTRDQLKFAKIQCATEKESKEEALQTAKKALKDASKAASKADADMESLTGKKEFLSGALADLETVKENGSATPEGKTGLKKLLSLAKDYGFDTTLSTSFATAAKKASPQRSSFEMQLFPSFQASMNLQIETLTKQIAEMEPVKAEKHAAEEAAKAALATTQESVATAKDELAKAEAAYTDSGKELHKVSAYLNSVWSDMKKACDAADALGEEIKEFKADVLTKFEHLKSLEPEPEVVIEAEETADGPAGEAEVAAEVAAAGAGEVAAVAAAAPAAM